jgi:hypothetical protein
VRWSVVTALIAISVGAVAFTVRASRESPASIVDARSLNWGSVTLEGKPLARMLFPAALLYVLPTCSHCAPAVQRFASETGTRGFSRLVIAGSDAGDVREYQHSLGLVEPIAVDSARSFARSAKLEWVPSLILLSADSAAMVLPVPAPVFITRYLKRLR